MVVVPSPPPPRPPFFLPSFKKVSQSFRQSLSTIHPNKGNQVIKSIGFRPYELLRFRYQPEPNNQPRNSLYPTCVIIPTTHLLAAIDRDSDGFATALIFHAKASVEFLASPCIEALEEMGDKRYHRRPTRLTFFFGTWLAFGSSSPLGKFPPETECHSWCRRCWLHREDTHTTCHPTAMLRTLIPNSHCSYVVHVHFFAPPLGPVRLSDLLCHREAFCPL